MATIEAETNLFSTIHQRFTVTDKYGAVLLRILFGVVQQLTQAGLSAQAQNKQAHPLIVELQPNIFLANTLQVPPALLKAAHLIFPQPISRLKSCPPMHDGRGVLSQAYSAPVHASLSLFFLIDI
jgi:hypothetical protein